MPTQRTIEMNGTLTVTTDVDTSSDTTQYTVDEVDAINHVIAEALMRQGVSHASVTVSIRD